MKFNLIEYVDSIVEVRNRRELGSADHLWLDGFNSIIKDSKLNFYLVEQYHKRKVSEHLKFTSFISSLMINNIIRDNRRRLADSSLIDLHLPISDNYHLEFPLFRRENICEFVYLSCEKCREYQKHGFPEIFLRQSVYFPKTTEVMFYDNRVSANHMERKVLIDAYKLMKDFIKNCRYV